MTKNPMIEALLNPNAYQYPVDYTKLLETHISWVILTGRFAYKIKKPVDFGFIDYSTLEKRHHYCEKELALNQPLAGKLYRKVVPIVKTAEGYHIDGEGEIVDYAVQMEEFTQDQLLNNVISRVGLSNAILDSIATQLAHFHMQAPHVDADSEYSTPAAIQAPTKQNFDQAEELLKKYGKDTDYYLNPLNEIKNFATQEYQRTEAFMAHRKKAGFVRSCHGDVYLGNITLINGVPTIFDCIEFNESFRWRDVICDTTFLVMDLYEHKHQDYAMRFLNTYLTYTGDYAGLMLMPYYFAYFCMVRAKIQLFSIQDSDSEETKAKYFEKFYNYMQLALNYIKRKPPFMVLMHGFSGSGKSTVANYIAQKFAAVVVRSDVERKRLFDLKPDEDSHSTINGKLYLPEVTMRTYQQLELIATRVIEAKYPVIIDATFLQATYRDMFLALAKHLNIPVMIVKCEAPETILFTRVANEGDENARYFSEANVKILEMQLKSAESLSEKEMPLVISVNTQDMTEINAIDEKINHLLVGK